MSRVAEPSKAELEARSTKHYDSLRELSSGILDDYIDGGAGSEGTLVMLAAIVADRLINIEEILRLTQREGK